MVGGAIDKDNVNVVAVKLFDGVNDLRGYSQEAEQPEDVLPGQGGEGGPDVV